MKYLFFFLLFIISCNDNIFSQVVINEVFTTNASAAINRGTYNYDNFIELSNTSAVTLTTEQIYLSNDASNLLKWKMPKYSIATNGCILIYPDGKNTGLHTNFKLDTEYDTLFLTNNATNKTEVLNYKKQYINISYGRIPDSNGKWAYFSAPTPKATNNSPAIAGQAGLVVFRTIGGFYDKSVSLTLANIYGKGTIYYTLNCSDPDSASLVYSQPLIISKTTVVRARVIEKNKIFGDIVTQTYFINERKPKLKIASIVTPPKNLTDDTIGIYVTGKNGIVGYCSDTRKNYNREWERTANFEFYDTDYLQKVNQQTGIEISGACSRGFPQKSLIVSTKGKYGKSRLKYKFFNNRLNSDFNSLLFRNSGNDWCITMFRDAAITKMTDGRMNLEHQADEPAVLYLNGTYYGIQNLYERSNQDLIQSITGIDPENIDLCEMDGTVLNGSGTDYQSLIKLIRILDLSKTSSYQYVTDQIDIDNLINYYIAEIYSCNDDWPGNNIKYWRQHSPKTKWRWIMYDTDFGFGLVNNYTANTLKLALTINSGWPNFEWSTILFRKLFENAEFRKKFVNRFYAHIGSTYEPTRIIGIIDSMANLIREEIPYHFSRWGQNSSGWEGSVEVMREFARQRPAYMRSFLRDTFLLGQDIPVTFKANATNTGTISFDGVNSGTSQFNGYFPKGTQMNIDFVPASGYNFVRAVKNIDYTQKIEFIKSGTEWKYFDSGPVNQANWMSETFADNAWKSGMSQFGYNENDERTTLYYGPDANNKFISYYFRDTFTVANISKLAHYKCRILYDDGAVIYLNGKELYRIGMPSGSINYNTLGIGPPAENVFYDIPFDSTLLKEGVNTIAVEVHQNSPTSSDISFDFELSANFNERPNQQIEIKSASITDSINGSVNYTAWFEPVVKYNNLAINEIAALNYALADEYGEYDDWVELYNPGPDTIDLARLYVSDSIAEPLKYCIPSLSSNNTKMNPNTYRILWADGTPMQGALHLGFKLSYLGEEFAISQKVGKTIYKLDSVKYGEFFGRRTFGRIPNGSGLFKWIYSITPNAENIDVLNVVENNAVENNLQVTINQTRQNLIVSCSNAGLKNNFELFAISGTKAITQQFLYKCVVNLNMLKPGMYIARVSNAKGVFCKKIIIEAQ